MSTWARFAQLTQAASSYAQSSLPTAVTSQPWLSDAVSSTISSISEFAQDTSKRMAAEQESNLQDNLLLDDADARLWAEREVPFAQSPPHDSLQTTHVTSGDVASASSSDPKQPFPIESQQPVNRVKQLASQMPLFHTFQNPHSKPPTNQPSPDSITAMDTVDRSSQVIVSSTETHSHARPRVAASRGSRNLAQLSPSQETQNQPDLPFTPVDFLSSFQPDNSSISNPQDGAIDLNPFFDSSAIPSPPSQTPITHNATLFSNFPAPTSQVPKQSPPPSYESQQQQPHQPVHPPQSVQPPEPQLFPPQALQPQLSNLPQYEPQFQSHLLSKKPLHFNHRQSEPQHPTDIPPQSDNMFPRSHHSSFTSPLSSSAKSIDNPAPTNLPVSSSSAVVQPPDEMVSPNFISPASVSFSHVPPTAGSLGTSAASESDDFFEKQSQRLVQLFSTIEQNLEFMESIQHSTGASQSLKMPDKPHDKPPQEANQPVQQNGASPNVSSGGTESTSELSQLRALLEQQSLLNSSLASQLEQHQEQARTHASDLQGAQAEFQRSLSLEKSRFQAALDEKDLRISSLQHQLEENQRNHQASVLSFQDVISRHSTQYKTAQQRLEDTTQERDSLATRLQEQEERNQDLETSIQQFQLQSEGKNSHLADSLAKIKHYEELLHNTDARCCQLQETILSLQQAADVASNQANAAATALEESNNTIALKQAQIESQAAHLDLMSQQYQDALLKIDDQDQNAALQSLQSRFDREIEQLNHKYQLLEQTLDEEQKLKSLLSSQCDDANAEIDVLKSTIQRIKTDNSGLIAQHTLECDQLRNDLELATQAYQTSQLSQNESANEIVSLTSKISALEAQLVAISPGTWSSSTALSADPSSTPLSHFNSQPTSVEAVLASEKEKLSASVSLWKGRAVQAKERLVSKSKDVEAVTASLLALSDKYRQLSEISSGQSDMLDATKSLLTETTQQLVSAERKLQDAHERLLMLEPYETAFKDVEQRYQSLSDEYDALTQQYNSLYTTIRHAQQHSVYNYTSIFDLLLKETSQPGGELPHVASTSFPIPIESFRTIFCALNTLDFVSQNLHVTTTSSFQSFDSDETLEEAVQQLAASSLLTQHNSSPLFCGSAQMSGWTAPQSKPAAFALHVAEMATSTDIPTNLNNPLPIKLHPSQQSLVRQASANQLSDSSATSPHCLTSVCSHFEHEEMTRHLHQQMNAFLDTNASHSPESQEGVQWLIDNYRSGYLSLQLYALFSIFSSTLSSSVFPPKGDSHAPSSSIASLPSTSVDEYPQSASSGSVVSTPLIMQHIVSLCLMVIALHRQVAVASYNIQSLTSAACESQQYIGELEREKQQHESTLSENASLLSQEFLSLQDEHNQLLDSYTSLSTQLDSSERQIENHLHDHQRIVEQLHQQLTEMQQKLQAAESVVESPPDATDDSADATTVYSPPQPDEATAPLISSSNDFNMSKLPPEQQQALMLQLLESLMTANDHTRPLVIESILHVLDFSSGDRERIMHRCQASKLSEREKTHVVHDLQQDRQNLMDNLDVIGKGMHFLDRAAEWIQPHEDDGQNRTPIDLSANENGQAVGQARASSSDANSDQETHNIGLFALTQKWADFLLSDVANVVDASDQPPPVIVEPPTQGENSSPQHELLPLTIQPLNLLPVSTSAQQTAISPTLESPNQ